MEGTESKLLVTLVGFLMLLSGVAWINFFPFGGLVTAIGGLVVLGWAFEEGVTDFRSHHTGRQF